MSELFMPKEIFSIKYDGTKLQNHEMDVALLAPALMSLGKLTRAISELASNGDYTATLSVKGNIKAGSIEIELTTQAVSLLKQVQDMFAGETATAVANFFGITAGIAGFLAGFYELIRRCKGASPTHTQKDGDMITMHFESHSQTVHQTIYHIYNNYEIRSLVYDTVRPLEEAGIDEFAILKDDKPIIVIYENQLHSFVPNNINTPLNETLGERILSIESLTFKEKNKWSFHDGQNSIKAVILDNEFLEAIDKGKRFAKGDWLKVELRTIQTEENGKLKTSYEIPKVLEHIIKEQYKLPL